MFHVQVIIKIGYIPYIFITPIKSKFSSGILLILSGLLVVLFSSAQAQTSEPYKWNSVFIGGGGFVSGLITSKEQPGLMYARTDVGGAYKWDAGTNSWLPLMDWVSERQQGILGAESLAIDPQNPNVVYISTGIEYFNNGKSYILRSSDYGANFTITEVTDQFKIHGNGMGRQNGEKLQVDPNNSSIVYCGTRWNGLFRSINFGSTWSRVKSLNVTTTANENGISFVVLDKASAAVGSATQRIFVGISRSGNNQNFYMSTNGGTDFSALVNPKLAADLMPQRAVLSGDGNLFITYGDGAGPHGDWVITTEDYTSGQIWKYNIASGAWTNVTPAGINRPFGGISVDPTNPQRLVASTTNTYLLQKGDVFGDRFFISTNGGKSWTDVVSRGFEINPNGVTWIPGESIHWAGCIEFDPSNPKKVWVTSGNGVFLNEDIDAAPGVWKFSVKGLEETVPLNMVSIPDGPQLSVIGDYDGFRHTDIEQYAPIHNPRIGTTTGLDYAVRNKNKVVRVGTSMYYSGDMGLTWTKTAVINGTKGQVALSADGNILLHSPVGSDISYRSTNNGSLWTTISGLNFKNARPVADGANPNKFYAYNNGAALMMSSTDGGSTFTAGGSPGNGGSRVIRTVPGREGHIWVALYGNGLSRSVNSGATFTKLNNVTQCSAVGIGKAAPGSAYETIYIYGTVNGVIGVHRSIDEGASWVRVNDDKHEYGGPANGQFVVGDMNVYGRVYMSTAGRGIAVGAPVSKRELNTPGFNSDETSIGGTDAIN